MAVSISPGKVTATFSLDNGPTVEQWSGVGEVSTVVDSPNGDKILTFVFGPTGLTKNATDFALNKEYLRKFTRDGILAAGSVAAFRPIASTELAKVLPSTSPAFTPSLDFVNNLLLRAVVVQSVDFGQVS